MSRKTLITGGAGFIGSHVVQALLARGESVTVLDDLSTGRLQNIAPFLQHEGMRFVEGSALDEQVVGELTKDSDLVIHLAAAVGVRLIVERPVHTIETNVKATEVVLAAAAAHKLPVILASTSEVYGKSTQIPFHEDADISLGPTHRSRWAYACSKALDEWLAFAYAAEKGVDVTIVRFFNTVGPRQTGQYGMVLPTFVGQALRGEPITVFGDGEQRRCFCHVSDTVEALLLLADGQSSERVINVGNNEEVSMLDLAKRVKAATSSDSVIELIPYDEAYAEGFEDMMRRVPDLARLKEMTGFSPGRDLTTIIDDVIADKREAD